MKQDEPYPKNEAQAIHEKPNLFALKEQAIVQEQGRSKDKLSGDSSLNEREELDIDGMIDRDLQRTGLENGKVVPRLHPDKQIEEKKESSKSPHINDKPKQYRRLTQDLIESTKNG